LSLSELTSLDLKLSKLRAKVRLTEEEEDELNGLLDKEEVKTIEDAKKDL
jgi:hypothetical protein